MFTCNPNPKATAETIARADQRGFEQKTGYTILDAYDIGEGAMHMLLRNDKSGAEYRLISADFDGFAHCSCPACEKDGYCKHIYLLGEEIQLWEQAEIYSHGDAEFVQGAGKY